MLLYNKLVKEFGLSITIIPISDGDSRSKNAPELCSGLALDWKYTNLGDARSKNVVQYGRGSCNGPALDWDTWSHRQR